MSKDNKNIKKIIAIVIAAILGVAIIGTAIYCIVEKESPAQMVTDMFKSTDEQIIGKWQGAEGVAAYEFYEDGTYDSYLTTFSYAGKYTIEGNKLILNNPSASGRVVYKVSVTEKELTMTLVEENGTDPEEETVTKFKRVNHISTKSIEDLLQDAIDEADVEE